MPLDTTSPHLGTNGGFGGTMVEGRSTSTETNSVTLTGTNGGFSTLTLIPAGLGGTSNAGFGSTSSTSIGGVTNNIGGTGGTTTGPDSMTTASVGGSVLTGLGGTSIPVYGGSNGTGGTTQQPAVDLIPENRRFFTLNPWPEPNISICYRSIDADQPNVSVYGAFVQSMTNRYWQRVANIQFTGWRNCAEDGGSIIVEFTQKEASSSTFGFPGWYKQAVVRLNTTNLSAAEALYYLGRTLGFGNEYNIDSLPGPCLTCKKREDCIGLARSTCMPSGFCGNPLEHESIMAPPVCGQIESVRPFSPWDIAGARWTYGQKPTGTLVSALGECAHFGRSGDTAYLSFCQGFDTDALERHFATKENEYDQFGSMYEPEPLCLTVNSTTTDSPVLSDDCDSTDPAQNLTMKDVRLRGLGGLCVVVAHPSAGTELTVATCGTASPMYLERWTVEQNRLRLSGTHLCASVKDNHVYVGASVILEECGSSPEYQTLRMRAGRIQVQGHCFDVSGGLPEVGKPIILWNSCSFQLDNDDFYLSGPVTTSPNRCLTVNTSNGLLWSSTCNDSLNQEWDYHF
jgi:hypothetical protein